MHDEDGDGCISKHGFLQLVSSELVDSCADGLIDCDDVVLSKNDQVSSSSTRSLITLHGNDRDNGMVLNLALNIGAFKKVTRKKIAFKRKNSGVRSDLVLSEQASNGVDYHGESLYLMMVKRKHRDLDVDMIDCDDSLLKRFCVDNVIGFSQDDKVAEVYDVQLCETL